jgi:feruloyl esterase
MAAESRPAKRMWAAARSLPEPFWRAGVTAIVLATCIAARPPSTCESLASLPILNTTILAAAPITGGSFTPPGASAPITGLPPFCRVAGEIRPSGDSHIRFELWLPLEKWNRKFAAAGNVGFGGEIPYEDPGSNRATARGAAGRSGYSMADQLNRGYATAGTDTGHRNDGADSHASFGFGHPERLKDFGYRAVHEMTVASKALTAAFYGSRPQHSYWLGMSTGGRQGLMEAQKFPDDYDGIIVGAPPLNLTWNWLRQLETGQAVANDSDRSLVALAALKALHGAVLTACDMSDGRADGVVGNPRRCTFDSAAVQCRDNQITVDCLTASQVAAARHVYSGLVDPLNGVTLNPGLSPGSEPDWATSFPGGAPPPEAISYVRWLVFKNAVWNWKNFDFALPSDHQRVLDSQAELAPVLNALNPDLRGFKRRGGKILHWHGWSDARVEPRTSLEYYDSVMRTSRSSKEDAGAALRDLQGFYRLFLVPGMTHGLGNGPGANMFDMLPALEEWVEKGVAPDRMIATHSTGGVVDRSRPLCPYPSVAEYKGAGDPEAAQSFGCVSK